MGGRWMVPAVAFAGLLMSDTACRHIMSLDEVYCANRSTLLPYDPDLRPDTMGFDAVVIHADGTADTMWVIGERCWTQCSIDGRKCWGWELVDGDTVVTRLR